MTSQPHHSRSRLAAALLALTAGIAACSSGTGSKHTPPPPATPTSDPSPSDPSSAAPASTPAGSASSPGAGDATATGKRISAYWFSIGSSFAGGQNWTIEDVVQPTNPNGLGPAAQGRIAIDGPNHASMEFDALENQPPGSADLNSALSATVSTEQVTVSQGPKQLTVDGQPALAVSGLNAQHNDTVVVVIDAGQHRGQYAVAQVNCPSADFSADQAAFQALLNSFQFDH